MWHHCNDPRVSISCFDQTAERTGGKFSWNTDEGQNECAIEEPFQELRAKQAFMTSMTTNLYPAGSLGVQVGGATERWPQFPEECRKFNL